MNRRSFFRVLGVAPVVAPVLAQAAIVEAAKPAPIMSTSEFAMPNEYIAPQYILCCSTAEIGVRKIPVQQSLQPPRPAGLWPSE